MTRAETVRSDVAKEDAPSSAALVGEDEWILTNSKGGYALGCRDLINRRKYHGLLVAASAHGNRHHLVSSVEERFEIGKRQVYLDANDYGDVVYPRGSRSIRKTWLRPYPAFFYEAELPPPEGSKAPSAVVKLAMLKEILMDGKENAVLLRYTNMGSREAAYAFRCKFSLRDHHHLNWPGSISSHSFGYSAAAAESGNESFDSRNGAKEDGGSTVHCWSGAVVSRGDLSVRMWVNGGVLREEPMVFRNLHYRWEAERGYDSREDLFAPFLLSGKLKRDESVEIIFSSTDNAAEREGPGCDALRDRIIERYGELPCVGTHPQAVRKPTGRITYGRISAKDTPQRPPQLTLKDYHRLLPVLLDDFRTADNVVAGYPWFSCWGRDAMISLKGFMDADGNADFALKVLRNYGRLIQNGLLPNVIGEGGEGTNYDTVDAALWYVLRVYELFLDIPPEAKRQLLGYAGRIVLNYRFNPNLPFRCDSEDGLIVIGNETPRAMTWMDAKVDGIPVTARYGKPIEISALWYNAVTCLAHMATELKIPSVSDDGYTISRAELYDLSGSLLQTMQRYYVNGIWCDRIFRGMPIMEIRPNFVIALSLPFDIADKKHRQAAVKCAQTHLLTPYGLRSLSPESQRYAATYRGTQAERDFAYHQGTVWTWLLLPYAQLLAKTILHEKQLKHELIRLVEPFRRNLRDGRFASVAEIWDGAALEPPPEGPKGAPAQAWSVAALIAIEKMIGNL